MKRDEGTYGRIADQYDEWVEIEAGKPVRSEPYPPPQPTATKSKRGTDVSRIIFAAIGIGIGVILLALAGYAFYTASTWAEIDRGGASVGYTLVGLFLVIAGLGGILATWNHNFRVLTRPPAHH